MAPRRLETDIDQLYQLPLEEFTSARNTLARTAGADAAEVRKLAKPPLAAWAVNQLYWKRREVYDARAPVARSFPAGRVIFARSGGHKYP